MARPQINTVQSTKHPQGQHCLLRLVAVIKQQQPAARHDDGAARK